MPMTVEKCRGCGQSCGSYEAFHLFAGLLDLRLCAIDSCSYAFFTWHVCLEEPGLIGAESLV